MDKTNNKQTSNPKDNKSSYTGLQRASARAALLLTAVLLIALIVLLFTGASQRALLTILFCLIVIPCVLYAFKLYIDVTVKNRKDKE